MEVAPPRGGGQVSSIISCENRRPKSIPQSYGAALNSNDSHITREVNSQKVFSCCSHVICGGEIDQYNYPGIIIEGFTQ